MRSNVLAMGLGKALCRCKGKVESPSPMQGWTSSTHLKPQHSLGEQEDTVQSGVTGEDLCTNT